MLWKVFHAGNTNHFVESHRQAFLEAVRAGQRGTWQKEAF